MARQRRIEFPGATYHVMARGDRKEPIVFNDSDRLLFLTTLGEMCQRCGIVIHAYTLLDNHYHLILETPDGNLVEGMKWFQNAYTRRINVRHDLWGHLFGGRYKSILIERNDDYFMRAVDYVHLNPVRAGQTDLEKGLAAYPWCSLVDYIQSPKQRPEWLSSKSVFGALSLKDTPNGRKKFLLRLEQKALEQSTSQAGLVTNEKSPGQNLQATIQRGWYFGSAEFKASLLDQLEQDESNNKYQISGGFSGTQSSDHSFWQANKIIQEGCLVLETCLVEFQTLKANDSRKVIIAELISSETTVALDWIREKLKMGSRSHCSRLINNQRRKLTLNDEDQRIRHRIRKRAISND